MSKIKSFTYHPTGIKHRGVIRDSKAGFDVIECQTCEFKHIIPIPTPREIEELYKEKFYSSEKPRYLRDVEEDLEWWNTTYDNYYELFKKYCSGKNKKLLEIGSGPGYFLKRGKEFGWDVLGFEPSKQAYEYSQKFGLKIINDSFSKKEAQKYGKFNVVYLNTVIEHLPDPISLIKDVREILAENGIICVVAPNDYNPLQKNLRDNLGFELWWVAPPQHINYFDFCSIKKLLARSGFEVVDCLGTFPMEFFLLAGDNYIGNNELGRKCHSRRKNFELNMYRYNREQLNAIYEALSKYNIGREFVVIGRKKEELGRIEHSDSKNSCRICGSEKFQPKITKKINGIESTWIECEQCGVQKMYPYPTENELASYYEGYLSKKCSGGVSHSKRFSDEYKDKVFKEYSYSLSDIGVRVEDLLKMKILDFGCANGAFLDYLCSIGAKKENLFGVDISNQLLEIAQKKGYSVFNSLYPLSNKKFDLVTLWDVIEHVENPRETIIDLKKVMRRGTKVLIQTPLIGFLSEYFGEEFYHYLPIEHIHLFPRETLLKLFSELGFRIIGVKSFGANASEIRVPQPYKSVFDRLAKMTDNGATQLALFEVIK